MTDGPTDAPAVPGRRAADADVDVLVRTIRESRDAIVARFQERARARLHLDDLSWSDLRDRVPQLLGAIATLVASSARPEPRDLDAHTIDRLQRGFDLAEVLREYAILRECLVDAWRDALGVPTVSIAALERLDRVLARITAHAADLHRESLEHHLRALEAFVDAGTTLDRDPGASLPRLAECALGAIGGAAEVSFRVGDEEGNAPLARARRDDDVAPDPELAARVRRERAPVQVLRDDRARFGIPLVHEDAVIGVAELVSRRGQTFVPEERLFFRAIANRAAASIAHGRLAAKEDAIASDLARTAAVLEAVFDHAPVGLALFDRELRYLRVNHALAAFDGAPIAAHVGRRRTEMVPEIAAATDRELQRVLETGEPLVDREVRAHTPARPDELRIWCMSAFPVSVHGRRVGAALVLREITAEARAHRALADRARQRAELAAFGLRALRTRDLQELFDDAVRTVTRTLGTELAKVLELLPGGDELVLRAGIGWRDGAVGRATVSADRSSQAGFTLTSRQPVIVRDLRTESRFAPPPLLLEHAVVSGVSAVIEAPGIGRDAFGVLGTHSRRARDLTDDDAAFVQAVANVLGAAVQRSRSEERAAFARRWGESQQLLADVSRVLAASLEPEEWMRDLVATVVPRLAERALALLRRPDGTFARAALGVTGRRADGTEACETIGAALPPADVLERLVSADRASLVDARDPRAALAATLLGRPPADSVVAPVRVHGAPVGALVAIAIRPSLFEHAAAISEEIARRWAIAVENAELYRDAREAVRAREDVLSIVSHDLRSPLHAIQLASASMRAGDLDRHARAQTERTLQVVDRAVLRMRRLIDDLLDFDSVRSGRLSLSLRVVDPRRVVADAFETFRFEAEERSLTLAVEQGDEVPEVCCDPERIQQCLANLVGNAMRVTAPGGTITLHASRRGDDALFVVRDTGPGIPAADRERIFERGWRGASGTYQGFGLGLAICRGIVEAHGGRIWAERVEGSGAALCFTIPGVQPPDGAPARSRHDGALSRGSRRSRS